MVQLTGKCRFCGQTSIMEYARETAQEIVDEDATLNCHCPEAKEYREDQEKKAELERSILSAKSTIAELFHDNHANTEAILAGAISPLANEAIKRVTVKINDSETATITKVNNTIKVNHTIKRTINRETVL